MYDYFPEDSWIIDCNISDVAVPPEISSKKIQQMKRHSNSGTNIPEKIYSRQSFHSSQWRINCYNHKSSFTEKWNEKLSQYVLENSFFCKVNSIAFLPEAISIINFKFIIWIPKWTGFIELEFTPRKRYAFYLFFTEPFLLFLSLQVEDNMLHSEIVEAYKWSACYCTRIIRFEKFPDNTRQFYSLLIHIDCLIPNRSLLGQGKCPLQSI